MGKSSVSFALVTKSRFDGGLAFSCSTLSGSSPWVPLDPWPPCASLGGSPGPLGGSSGPLGGYSVPWAHPHVFPWTLGPAGLPWVGPLDPWVGRLDPGWLLSSLGSPPLGSLGPLAPLGFPGWPPWALGWVVWTLGWLLSSLSSPPWRSPARH